MKKTIIVAILALGFIQAVSAGSYSHAVSVQQFCQANAGIAEDIFERVER